MNCDVDEWPLFGCLETYGIVYFSILQLLCNTWNIGYILVPLQRIDLKEVLLFDQIEVESCRSTLAGNMMEFTHLFFLSSQKSHAPENCQLSLQSKSPELT